MKYFVSVICKILSLPNGLINYTSVTIHGGFPVDTEAIFSCKCGYLLSGPKSRICETSGNWSLSATACAQSTTTSRLLLFLPITKQMI